MPSITLYSIWNLVGWSTVISTFTGTLTEISTKWNSNPLRWSLIRSPTHNMLFITIGWALEKQRINDLMQACGSPIAVVLLQPCIKPSILFLRTRTMHFVTNVDIPPIRWQLIILTILITALRWADPYLLMNQQLVYDQPCIFYILLMIMYYLEEISQKCYILYWFQ